MRNSRRIEATVVVPCMNEGAALTACLAALDEQTIRDRLRVVVVDNGSVDDSVARARATADDVLTTSAAGPSGPRNRGLEITTSAFFLSVDADCVPSRAWAELHLEALRDAPPDVLASTGRFEPFPTSDRWALREDTTPQTSWGAAGPNYALAGNGCFRTGLLRTLGGFPQFGADDGALGAQARASGLRFIYVPDATVLHRNPEGWWAYARQARKIGRYGAEFELEGPWFGHLVRTRARMMGGALRPVLKGDCFETVALMTAAIAGGVGVVDARRSRSNLALPSSCSHATRAAS